MISQTTSAATELITRIALRLARTGVQPAEEYIFWLELAGDSDRSSAGLERGLQYFGENFCFSIALRSPDPETPMFARQRHLKSAGAGAEDLGGCNPHERLRLSSSQEKYGVKSL
eukprot:jgi/Phyca11/17895/fgenesh1_pg.PHYCAscaffold_31_\